MGAIHEFELVREQQIKEINTKSQLFRHIKTGAQLLSLMNEDENKVFGITFRTPPSDSTGLPHILEHSVLCGSRKYPLKEPFVELLKGSLHTFLNAFTYPDRTCYPVASQNVQDFYNLVDVYLDAVLHPRLTPHILQQEGWHLDLERLDDPLTYKGVVYNEMKGAYSSPDTLLAEYSQQSLFPDNAYGLDSGGDPKVIPTLTYDQFLAFHRTYYHPSNARIFFYGDDDPERRLSLVNGYLKEFDRMEIASLVRLQPLFTEPRRITKPYASGAEDKGGAKGMITINWLLPETTITEIHVALHILEYALLGMPGSPLRKALIDSGYGEDLAGGGLSGELRQMYFSTGLKGVEIKDMEQVETLILDILSGLALKGFDPLTVEAAVNTIEFGLRENNTGSYPRGLVLMLRALTTWLYEEDPLALVAFEDPLETVKSKIVSSKGYLEGMLDRFFLKNPHRTRLVLKPDPEMAKKEEAAEQERLAGERASLGPSDLEGLVAATHVLRKMQETPDPPEALAAIPSLKLSDLSRESKTIPLACLKENGTEILFHDLFTSGIVYLDLGLNLRALPQEYLPYVRLFGRSLLEMGTEKEDFVALSQRISRKTGGIGTATFASAAKGADTGPVWLFLRGKAMLDKAHELLHILRDVLLTVRLDNRERFRQMVLEAKAREEQKLVPSGHQVVNLRLRSPFSEADWAAEQMRGVSYLFFLRHLARAVDADWEKVLEDLREVHRILVNRNAMILNVTLDEKGWTRSGPIFREFLDALHRSPVSLVPWAPGGSTGFEGLTIPAQINYVGKGMSLYPMGYRFHGSAHVITRYLRNAWLWEKVRVQGGAYGAFCLFDRLSGIITFVSYRDPNLLKTLDAFDRSAPYLEELSLDKEELRKAIIGTIGDIDQYQLPDAKGYTSMARRLCGESDEERQRMREEVLATTGEDFRAFGRTLRDASARGLVKVLGPRSAMEEVLAARPGWLDLLEVL